MSVIQNVIVLGTLKYGDSSLISHCYSAEYGLQSYMLKGVLGKRTKTGLQKSMFQPLSILEIVATKVASDRLGYIKEVQVESHYQTIPFDMRKKGMVFFLSETLHQVLREEEGAHPELFAYLKKALIWLDQNDAIGLFAVKIMLDLTHFLGLSPRINNPDDPYFDLENGYSTPLIPYGKHIGEALNIHWKTLLGTDFDGIAKIYTSQAEKSILLDHALDYYSFHLQQFKTPKSRVILNEVFKPV